MNNTEIFELCENSSRQQCLDSNTYWKSGIIYCSCGRNMKSSRSPTEFDQNNRDVTSFSGNVIKKNSSRGAEHGLCERQRMCYRRNRCLKRPVRESTDAIQRYFHDGTPVNRTEIRCMTSGGERNTLYCATESPWRSTSTSPQELKEFKLDYHDNCRRTSATTQSTTRLRSSEKRMQTIA